MNLLVAQLPFEPVTAILVIPGVAALLLALLPGYKLDRSAQRVCDLSHIPRGSIAACRAPRERHLSVRRRSQRRLRRARHLRRLHDQRLQRELHRARDRDRPANARASALLSCDVPGPDVRHEPRASRQQHRPHVGGDRAGDAHDGADGRHLSHARGARGGVEIFHPRQRRHRAGAVRHDPRLHGGAAGGRRRSRRHGVDDAHREGRRTSAPSC